MIVNGGTYMTRDDLEQIYYLNRELKMWERELERLQGQSLVRSPVPNAVRGSGVADKVADRGDETADLERKIKARRELVNEVLRFIDNIPKARARIIVREYCLKNKPWDMVVKAVGGKSTEESVKHTYHRFIKKHFR